jgi:hypothetical protein
VVKRKATVKAEENLNIKKEDGSALREVAAGMSLELKAKVISFESLGMFDPFDT